MRRTTFYPALALAALLAACASDATMPENGGTMGSGGFAPCEGPFGSGTGCFSTDDGPVGSGAGGFTGGGLGSGTGGFTGGGYSGSGG